MTKTIASGRARSGPLAGRAAPAGDRQVDGEGAAGAHGTVDVERAAMAVEDVLHDGEAEAGAAELARPHGLDAVEALGQAWQMLARDALALVHDGDGDRRPVQPARRE